MQSPPRDGAWRTGGNRRRFSVGRTLRETASKHECCPAPDPGPARPQDRTGQRADGDDVDTTASSVTGFVSTSVGSALGWAIGDAFDGSVMPLTLGFAACAGFSIVIVLIAEPRRFMRTAG
ncbi:MAG: multidrug effflux MFS transporter [Rhodospirillaceae bacterium]|nr:multidrug effflux MFS transporter [Rhodospirillaceae bacterium]